MRRGMLPLGLTGLLILASGQAVAQPNGAEFLVNSATPVNQQHPRVARRFGAPGFIVVWEDGGGVVTDIFAATFTNLALKQAFDFRVNTYLTGFQTYPSVAGAYDGTFTVAWESKAQNEGSYGVYVQRSSSAGSPIGTELLVSSFTTGIQRHPFIAPGSGSTRLVFEGNGAGDTDGVFLSDDPFTTLSRVNLYTPGLQKSPSVSTQIALLFGTPDYLVVWGGNGADLDQGIYGQLYDTSGLPYGSEFRINTTTAGDQTAPVVAGHFFAVGFIVVWETPIGGLHDVYAQRLDQNGTPRGPEFRVNTYTTGNQDQPQVAVDDAGNFVIVWSSYQDGSARSVHAQAFSVLGVPVGIEYRLNSYTTSNQRFPSVAATGEAAGKFVVVWQSFAQEGPSSNEGIFGRLFTVSPVIPGDVDGNGFVNVSDVLYLINYLFAGGAAPIGDGDVDNANGVNVSDVLYLINYLFAGGPNPI